MTERGLALEGAAVEAYGRSILPATSLSVSRGSSLAILGDAGSGKSTVLRMLAGRRRADAGTVRFDDGPIASGTVGFVDQQHVLPEGMTTAEHLAVPLLVQGRPPRDWAGIERLLTKLGLPPATQHNLLEELSGGQQQRVAIGRALIGEPALICADDPVSELDGASAELVWAAFDDAVAAGATLVFATSDPGEAARAGQVLRLA